MDQTISASINKIFQIFENIPGIGQFVHKFFSRVLPLKTFVIRGVAIRCAIPLHQTGTFNEAHHWSQREPEVLDWIDSFGPGAIFFDIGANFGTETLYAAMKPQGATRVCAFDAEFIGGYNLALNIRLNGLTTVDNYACAVGARNGYLSISENINYLWVFDGEKYGTSRKIIPVISIDSFAETTGILPTHIKIDVDGPEADIVSGMQTVLSTPGLQSLMIEINSPDALATITATLTAKGFGAPQRPNPDNDNYIFRRA